MNHCTQPRRAAVAALLLAIALPGAAALAAEPQKPFHIYMAVWRGCEDACKGFQAFIRENKIPAKITIRDAERRKAALPEFVAEAKRLDVDLVVTWGTTVSRVMLGPYDKPDPDKHLTRIPAVFMIVADPIGARIVRSYESSGRANVTGTRNRAPTAVQFKALQTYRPFKRLGLIYNPDELNARLNAEAVRKVARQMKLELVEAVLPLGADGKPSPDSIEPAVARIAAQNVGFLYVGSSSFLSRYAKPFTAAAVRHGVPVAAGTEILVTQADGLVSIASRYYNVGQLAGYQAKEILVERMKPIEVRIRRLRRFSYIINMDTARKLKIYPPVDLLRYAEVVNGKPDS